MRTSLIIAALGLLLAPLTRAADGVEMLSTSVVASNATATVSSPVTVTVPFKGSSLTIMPTFSAENAGTSNVVFTLNLSADGSTWTTTGPLSYTMSANGTNVLLGWQTFAATNFVNGVMKVRLSTVSTTQTNNVTVTSVKAFTLAPYAKVLVGWEVATRNGVAPYFLLACQPLG